MSSLRITEIFLSLQGEGRSVGYPTVFVRLTGCPLRCDYCDTTYAFKGGEWLTRADVFERIAGYEVKQVCVTGGEPLAQQGCADLLYSLCEAGYEVSLETSGAVDLCHLDPRVIKVMDLKTPGSGEVDRNRYENIDCLAAKDQIKFVICDETDYHWSREQVDAYQLTQRCEVLFSPSFAQLEARQLADWIVRDRLPVRFQYQLHKQLWGDKTGV